MKKVFALLLGFLLLCGAALAEEVSFGGVSFDRSAEAIDMGDRPVENFKDFIAFLQEFPNLKKVDMYATGITAENVEKLENAFPGITFGWYLKMMRYHFVRTDADAYSALDGSHPRHTDEEFKLLKYCPGLLALDLGHNDIRKASFLRSMPDLRLLILAENPNLHCLELISTLQDLEYLELFSCGIEDISPLTALTGLMDLNLSNNRVKDWRPLKEMKWLRRLWISGMCTGNRKKPELTHGQRLALAQQKRPCAPLRGDPGDVLRGYAVLCSVRRIPSPARGSPGRPGCGGYRYRGRNFKSLKN